MSTKQGELLQSCLSSCACEWVNVFSSLIPCLSVSYPFVYDLDDHAAKKGSNITLSIDLAGGTTFKIIGLMLCNS